MPIYTLILYKQIIQTVVDGLDNKVFVFLPSRVYYYIDIIQREVSRP